MIFLDREITEELWKRDLEGSFPILLTVNNPDIFWTEEEKQEYKQEDGSLNLISDNVKVMFKDKLWLPCAFSFQPPEKNGSKVSTASISISAIDARVRKILRMITLESNVKVVALFSKQRRENGKSYFKFSELNSAEFKMTSATCNKTVATFNLDPDLSLTQNIPYDTAIPNRTPAVRED